MTSLSAEHAAPSSGRTPQRDLLLIGILAFLPLLFYMAVGYGGHDFKYHASAWAELHDAWMSHSWVLGWSPWAHYGFGEPSFCFYPPLSLLLGAGLSFVLPFRFVPGAVVWVLLAVSGLTMYQAAAVFVPRRHRLSVAVLYMFNPYLLMTIVLRFAIAEALNQALLPLALACFYVLVCEDRLRLTLASACFLAAGWLSNISAAIGTAYAFSLLALGVAVHRRSWRPLILGIGVQALGFALAAFRLVPTLAEKGWISSQNLLIYNFRDYMQLKRIPQPHLMVYTSGAYIALSLALLIPAVRDIVKHRGRWYGTTIALLSLAMFAVFFQVPISVFFWQHLPQFKFILFPYRLLPLLALASLLLLYGAGVSGRLQRFGMLGLLMFALFPFFTFGRLLPMQRFASVTAALASWRTGFEGVLEYIPVHVPAERSKPSLEKYLAKQGPFASPDCSPLTLSVHPEARLLHTSSPKPCSLLLNTYYYPFWHARADGKTSLVVGPNSDGLLQVDVPLGEHEVLLSFVPQSRVRRIAAGVSLLVLLILTLLSLMLRGRKPLFDLSRAQ